MRVAYVECFAGISGDMLLGALIDAGVSKDLLSRTVERLDLGAVLQFTAVDRSGIRATKVDVLVEGIPAEVAASSPAEHSHSHSDGHAHTHSHSHTHSHTHADGTVVEHAHSHEHTQDAHQVHEHADHHHTHVHGRGLPQIRTLIQAAGLTPGAERLAIRTFELLGESEARIHNVPVEEVHFHEVGAVDAIVDIVCAAVGLDSLGVDDWVCSPLNVGGGFVECAHGRFPVPAPATADLLRGAPTYSSGIQMELVTPTGAALIRALGCRFGASPRMRVETIGYGAGSRDPKRFPNVVRISLGDSTETGVFPSETITVLECAVDDLSPQVLAHAMQLALEQGALDVMSSAVQMKKGRLGALLTVLCRPEEAADFEALLFRETSTLGVRVREERRVYLERTMVEVSTDYGVVRVKIGTANGEQFNAMPEYEDCRRLAGEHGVPLKQVMQAAMAAFSEAKVQA
jgi:pyridinium-3,5-bisthiocarboxylic acid mononucleotide nickel chelatase